MAELAPSPTITSLSHTATPLLLTKLYPPRLRADFVSRPRLVARLNHGFLQRKLTLITAPTGSGKTTLLAEWLYSKSEVRSKEYGVGDSSPTPYSLLPTPRIAWLSLDKNDNEVVRFWSYVLAALGTVQPGLGESSLAMLQSAQPLPLETILVGWLNEIAACPGEFTLVLDDYHEIDQAAVHQSLAFLLDQMPPTLHLVIVSRASLPLALGHLRARGQLLELRAGDLRFTPDEAASFLNYSMGLNLSGEQIKILEAKTEGWIAGLQLAALSMQGRDAQDTSAFIAAFSGSHRYLLDYLGEELLQRQPEYLQQFLLQTSILDRLCGPLCDAVMGDWRLENKIESPISNTLPGTRLQSQTVLEQLERANLFLIPLDDDHQWYRYHHLLADLLRSRLNQAPPRIPPASEGQRGGVTELHRRAADWFEHHGRVAEALGHALAAADVERAIRLAEQHARTMFSRSELTTLLSWFNALPAELVRSQPQLSFFQAWALAFTGQLDAVETYLQSLEADAGEVAAIRATVAYLRRDMAGAVTLYRQALETLPPENLFLRGAVALSLGIAQLWQGELAGASQALSQASDISYSTGNLHVALTAQWNLAQAEIELGRLSRATELCQQALAWGHNGERALPAAVGGVYISLAGVLYEQNKLAEAGRHLAEGLKFGEQAADLGLMALGQLTLARLKQAQGDWEHAFKLARITKQLARQYQSSYWTAQAAASQARLWLTQGQLEAAQQWAAVRSFSAEGPLNFLQEAEYLVWARLLLAQAQPAPQPAPAALSTLLKLLSRLQQAAQAGGRTGRVLQVMVLQALAQQRQGDLDQALATLEQTLPLAEPEGYVRLFVDEGEPLQQLLTRLQAKGGRYQDYVTALLAAFSPSVPLESRPVHPAALLLHAFLVEPLSERELEILRLIAAGLSNIEIAQKIVVTVGTVKWHLNNIYGKLNVRSRTQAIVKARELGLI